MKTFGWILLALVLPSCSDTTPPPSSFAAPALAWAIVAEPAPQPAPALPENATPPRASLSPASTSVPACGPGGCSPPPRPSYDRAPSGGREGRYFRPVRRLLGRLLRR